ncbi:MAG: acyl-CoA synthetase [Thermodesulfobacteriota bacterium]
MPDYRHVDLTGLEQYEKTPLDQRLPFCNTYQLLQHGAAINPASPALSFIPSGKQWDQPLTFSYQDLLARVTQSANLFHDLGVGPRDVISYLLPNLPQTHFVLWGGEAAGIVNPINPLLEPATIADICQAAGTKVLVTLGPTPGADLWQKAQAVRERLTKLKAVVQVGGAGEPDKDVVSFDRALGNYPGDRLVSDRRIDPQDTASMYHTGGTTGTPKLAPHTHYMEAAMAFMTAAPLDLAPGESLLCGLPLFHVNGTTVTGSMPFCQGAHVVLLSPAGYRDPSVIANFYRIVERYRAVMFSAVPTVLGMLLDVPKGQADISSLRFLVCGAAPLSVELFQRFEAYTGMKIIEGYGLTEGTCVSTVNPLHGERKIGSIGLRVPYHQMKIIQLDEEGRFLRDAQVDEIGSVAIKGPNVFKGYLDPAHNKGCWPGDDWFNTGDLGRQDADGYFWLTGRKKELIIRGGHNIDPAMIEGPLYQLPGVQVAAAVGRPDPHAGEVPVVYVQLQEGAQLTPEEILEYLKQKVGERAAMPKEAIILPAMPLTPVGKIFKPALRWDAVQRVYSQELKSLGGMAQDVEVAVGEDKVHGVLASISLRPAPGITSGQLERMVRDLLSLYTVKYLLRVE